MADGGFGKKIEDFGQNVWKKAQGAVDIVSLNNELATKKRELDELYAEIGQAFCKEHGEQVKAAFPDRYGMVRQLLEESEALEERLRRKKGMKKCPRCGTLVPLTAAFCSACGAEVPSPEPEAEAESETSGDACSFETCDCDDGGKGDCGCDAGDKSDCGCGCGCEKPEDAKE